MGKNITRLLLATITLATGLLLASPGFCQTAQEYLNQGETLFQSGALDKAIVAYNEAIALDPNLAQAYNDRGLAYLYKGDYVKAMADYNKAIALKPDYADAYDHRGNVYSRKDQYDLAIADYSKAISLKPDFAFAYYNRGNVYYSKEQYDLAIADWNKAIALEPAKYKAPVQPVLDRAKVLLKMSGTPAYKYYMQGDDYLQKGALDEALRALTKAIASDPTFTLPYDDRAKAFWFHGYFDLAISDASKAIALNPNDTAAYYIRGYAYYKKRTEHQKAIDDWTKVLALDPGSGLDYELGSLIENEKAELKKPSSTVNYDNEEMQYLTEEIAQNPKGPFNFDARGHAYERKGHYDKAIADWQKAIELFPDFETELRPKIAAAKAKLKK